VRHRKLEGEERRASPHPADEDALAGMQLPAHEEGPVGGEAGQRKRRGLLPREMPGLWRKLRDRNRHLFRKRSVARQPENRERRRLGALVVAPVKGRVEDDLPSHPCRVGIRPDRRHDPGAVRTRDAGELQARVLAKLDPEIPVVERGGPDLDERLARRRRRIGHFSQRQLVYGTQA
jgi:hypothetical protein